MSKRNAELVRLALSYLIANLDDALECCEGSEIESMTEAELQVLHDAYAAPQQVSVLVGVDGISVPTCPPGVTVEIQESADGYRHTSRYDHTGRLD